MEHIYTIKVKRQFDPRGQYPSERRYSASTVFGFAWVHLALAFISFLLACLSLYNPASVELDNVTKTHNILLQNASKYLDPSELSLEFGDATDSPNETEFDTEPSDILENVQEKEETYPTALIISPCLLALGAFVAGFGAIVASRKWYIDHSITWFFFASIFSTVLSAIALCMIAIWIAEISDRKLSFCDYFSNGDIFKNTNFEIGAADSELGNNTVYYVIKVPLRELRSHKIPLIGENEEHKTRKVLSINILIAATIEILWSLLSLKISWNGMNSSYPDDETLNNRGNGATVHVVSEIKGNNTKRLPKNTKILPPQPDLITHYPQNNKIKKFFQIQQENGGYFLNRNQNENGVLVVNGANEKMSDFPRHESNLEYKERMLNFLNKCATSERVDSPESYTNFDPASLSPDSYPVTAANAEGEEQQRIVKNPSRISILSWGDSPDYPVYDQNTLDLEKIVLRIPSVEKLPIKPNDEVDCNNLSNEVNEFKEIKLDEMSNDS